MSLFGLTLSIAALAQPGTIITFNVPGGGTGFRQGTTATSINAAGVIAGYYVDASGSDHGFIRSRDGVFTVFPTPSLELFLTASTTRAPSQGTTSMPGSSPMASSAAPWES
jgi:hypothetical protein